MKKLGQNTQGHKVRALLLSLALLTGQFAYAQNQADTKVIVIPLLGDDTPAVSHPVADTYTNSLGMQFNTLPAGSFIMGSPVREGGTEAHEEIEHMVTLTKAFGMQITEVTNGQWNAVIVDSSVGGVNPSSNHNPENQLDNHPVDTISWYDAVFFANQLSSNEGRSACYTFSGERGTPGNNLTIANVTRNVNCSGYRLPTEAEWEYAARAGTTTAYANPTSYDNTAVIFGTNYNSNLHAMGWYRFNNEMVNSDGVATYPSGPKPVGKKQANAWGLYDMHGNVFEWTGDSYEAYSSSPVTDPVGGDRFSTRMARGGSFYGRAINARSAARIDVRPNVRSNIYGFRIVLPQVQ